MILPWSPPFAPLLVGELGIDRDELEQLEVSGRYRTARLHSPLRGLYPVSTQPTWPGSTAFVVRSVTCDSMRMVLHTNRTVR